MSIGITRSLIIKKLVFEVASSEAVTISRTFTNSLPLTARIGITFSNVGEEVALGVTGVTSSIPFTSSVVDTNISATVEGALLATSVEVGISREVVPITFTIIFTLIHVGITAHFVDASVSEVSVFAIRIVVADSFIVMSITEVALKNTDKFVVGVHVRLDEADRIFCAVGSSVDGPV